MKIFAISDLHLEHSKYTILNPNNADVLILAGDITPASSAIANGLPEFLSTCKELFEHVIYVPGNHEYDHSIMWLADGKLQRISESFGVRYLQNQSIVIDDVLFVGSTLWTNINNKDPLTMMQLGGMMSDFSVIRVSENELLTTANVATVCDGAISYISSTLQTARSSLRRVVITHHGPSYLSTDTRYTNNFLMNGGFVSDFSNVILDAENLSYWIHGHIHENKDYMIGDTRVICNPRGYHDIKDAVDEGFNPELILEI